MMESVRLTGGLLRLSGNPSLQTCSRSSSRERKSCVSHVDTRTGTLKSGHQQDRTKCLFSEVSLFTLHTRAVKEKVSSFQGCAYLGSRQETGIPRDRKGHLEVVWNQDRTAPEWSGLRTSDDVATSDSQSSGLASPQHR